MDTYFNIRYEFDKKKIHSAIDTCLKENKSDYICVADGVILNIVNRREDYKRVVNGGMFSICDSSYVPLYIKWIYDRKVEQYCGSNIFIDIIKSCKYRMIFIGSQMSVLNGLKKELIKYNPAVEGMKFIELPFCDVSDFNYSEIADVINESNVDIIWVALGAPKQEQFMALLKPHLNRGIQIAVGAAFKFYSGVDVKRAPEWMVRNHLEFVYRIFSEPKKQIKRCSGIIATLPGLLISEWRRKHS